MVSSALCDNGRQAPQPDHEAGCPLASCRAPTASQEPKYSWDMKSRNDLQRVCQDKGWYIQQIMTGARGRRADIR
jgi:hypothetical protein